MNKSYHEIRNSCLLVDYCYKLAGISGLWVETYQDNLHEYCALFSSDDTTISTLPLTITKYEITDMEAHIL